jgi:hypothetical protein
VRFVVERRVWAPAAVEATARRTRAAGTDFMADAR